MNAETFAEWMRRQGHRVVRTVSSYWYDASPRVYQAFPYHWLVRPSEEELSRLLMTNRAIGLRYSTPVEGPVGCISYHAVREESPYDLAALDRRTRQNVRAGLSRCQVGALPLERLAEEGWQLEADTAARQGRRVSLSQDEWRRRYLAADGLPGFEAWGAFVENRLVASLLTCQVGDCCEMLSQQCHHDFLAARVNNALAFVVTQTMMQRSSISSIFYTLQSLDAPASVDEFKFRMGYQAKPVRQRVVFHPWLAPLICTPHYTAVKALLRRMPGNPVLSKLGGMLRMYLQGSRSLQKQDWPSCLQQSYRSVTAGQ